MNLLIHHHAIIFKEGKKIWVQSFIGAWINELCKHFDTVGLLFFTSDQKLPQQDFVIEAPNLCLYNLGDYKIKNNKQRNRHVREVCASVSDQYDVLLIRGITPKQMMVYQNCKVPTKAFLMVGSIKGSKKSFVFSKLGVLLWALHKWRMYELRRIGKKSLMLTNSPTTKSELLNEFGIQAQFIPTNTISKSHFIPLDIRPIRSKLELLFCGRVVEDKGIEELIHAISILKNQYSYCILHIVGGVANEYKNKLENLTKAYGIQDQVIFHGFVSFGEQLLTYYRNADIYILPSWHEGFPHSIWEAACSCTPIIVTRVGGIPGIVSSEEVLFIAIRNAESIVNAIVLTANDSIARTNRIRKAYNLALEYTIEKCGLRTVDYLNTKVNKRNE